MAPMTRNRADANHVPTPIMAEYYAQRAAVGLIITEGTSSSPNGLGYPRQPGLFNAEHVAAWKPVTSAVHANGGKIFLQVMHNGRAGHVANLPAGAEVVSSTAVPLEGQVWTDALGMQTPTTPRPMNDADIAAAIAEYAHTATLAIDAGFDGIELHGANGYLIEQFLNANVNTRTDTWGGSPAARNRFALAVAKACVDAIGSERVAIRLSPYGVFNSTGAYADVAEQYEALARELGALKLAYLHVIDRPEFDALKPALRKAFGGIFIVAGGYDRAKAEAALADGSADLIAFGKPALANPDFVERLKDGAALNAFDTATFYSPGEKGYTDYPVLAKA
jgi:N-ethylmaleimide reductase